jgi:hypothetical protein
MMRAERAHKVCTVRFLGDLESKGVCIVYDVVCRSCCYAEISSDQPCVDVDRTSDDVCSLCSSGDEARTMGKRALDTSSEAVAENKTIILANDYGFNLQDVVVVESNSSTRSKPPLIPRIYIPQQSDLHPFSLK